MNSIANSGTNGGANGGKVLVTGHLGMLGRDLMERLGPRAIGMDRAECDVTDRAAVDAAVAKVKPAAIVNCTAFTDVDGAETQAQAARALNAAAVEWLGRAAAAHGAHFITIGTDYVFHGRGDQPFAEDAPPEDFGPESVYGSSKLEGEQRLATVGGDWCIARTEWLYGASRKNFIEAIAGAAQRAVDAARHDPSKPAAIKVVSDQIGAPTWTRDLAEAIERLLAARATGTYHLLNSGWAGRDAIARYIVQSLGIPCEIQPCLTAEFPRPAVRPLNSRMSQPKYAALAGAPLRSWQAALDEYFAVRAATATTQP